MMAAIPLTQRPVCSAGEACAVSTLRHRTIAYALAAGLIASVKRGSRRLVSVPSMMAYLSPVAGEGA